MLLPYSIKGLSLLTKSKRVGNFLSKWETFRRFSKSFPPLKSLQPQGIWCPRWETGKLFFKLIFESHNNYDVRKKKLKKVSQFPT